MRLKNEMPEYKKLAEKWLNEFATLSTNEIVTGRDAWTVAHNSGICRLAYDISRDITDAHIQTVLEQIFPNAIFKDAKRY